MGDSQSFWRHPEAVAADLTRTMTDGLAASHGSYVTLSVCREWFRLPLTLTLWALALS